MLNMKLVIAEKPSVAGDIAKVIGATTKKDGFWEGNNYQVTWCIGHLVQLAPPEAYGEQYKKWDLQTLPIMPENFKKNVGQSTKKQFEVVKKLIEASDEIVCATDAGREGQLIFEYTFRMTKDFKTKNVQRLWISSMTDEAIQNGFAHLKSNGEYENLYESARCRSEADWLVGMNFTRLFTVKYGTKLTVGRVQTPTLAMIVDRHLAIENFKVEKFFMLDGQFGEVTGKWSKDEIDRLKTKSEAVEIQARLIGASGTVTKLDTVKRSEERPLLFDLTELQREANRRFGYTAQETLNIAQSLYETHKLTTYPRTDSRCLTEDMKAKLPELLSSVAGIFPESKVYIEKILKDGVNADKRVIDNSKVSDHHAIIVTNKIGNYDPKKLSDKEINILQLVMVRLIVALSTKKEYNETKLEITIDGETDKFSATGRIILNDGWTWIEKHLLGNKSDSDDETGSVSEDTVLPSTLAIGQSLKLNDVVIQEKKTTPPKLYTEATLLTAMEKASREIDDEVLKNALKEKGLGSPATRASIIEKLISVGYMERKKKALVPTEQGIKFISLVPDQVKAAELTAEWEKRLDDIANAQESPEQFIKDIRQFVTETIEANIKVSAEDKQAFKCENTQSNKEVIGECPRCGKRIFENKKSFYCEGYKDEPKCSFSLWKEDKFFGARGKKITKSIAQKLLKNGQAEVNGLKSKAGKDYDAIFIMEVGEKYVNFKMDFASKAK